MNHLLSRKKKEQYPGRPIPPDDNTAPDDQRAIPTWPLGADDDVMVNLERGIFVNKDTVKVKQIFRNPDKYLLEFYYDATVRGSFVFRFLSQPIDGKLLKDEIEFPSLTVDAKLGFNQKFSMEAVNLFLTSNIKSGMEFEYLLIYIVCPPSSDDISANTSGQLNIVEVVKGKYGGCQPKVTYQFILKNGVRYLLHDSIGINAESDAADDGGLKMVGKLWVLINREIGRGSDGIIYEGVHEFRSVAVKKVPNLFIEAVVEAIRNQIEAEPHTNIVRYFGFEQDEDFGYIVMERCIGNLQELILSYNEFNANSESEIEAYKDFKLWNGNWSPSPVLLTLIRGIIRGIGNLHKSQITHGDLKPQNILIRNENSSLIAKLSDMGINKRTTGIGSFGWRAPEVVFGFENQTSASDLFSLGCLVYFCFTHGQHPFGEDVADRENKIMTGIYDIFMVENDLPEAHDLISRLLDPEPTSRPTAEELDKHPLFWDVVSRLSFYRDASEVVNADDCDANVQNSVRGLSFYKNWKARVDKEVRDHRNYREYDALSLLRAIRNMYSHYESFQNSDLQQVLGEVPIGFDAYFARRFPNLLIDVFNALKPYYQGVKEGKLARYYNDQV